MIHTLTFVLLSQSSQMRLSIIVAMSENGVIGRNNSLPWNLPGDLANFREKTIGKPVIMGRKTLESIGKPLPNRKNIVITKNKRFYFTGTTSVNNLDDAIKIGREFAGENGGCEIMVIGGAKIYAASLKLVNRLYVTEVHSNIIGDVTFPRIDEKEWSEISREFHPAFSGDSCDYSFVIYDRVVTNF